MENGKKLETVFFDLDGTLTDPGLGITNSVAYALRKLGIMPPARERLYPFIGPPLLDSFRRYYGFDEQKSHEALILYREYFSVTGLFENTLYEGVPEMLRTLRENGYHLVVATSKPEPFTNRILKHFELDGYFDFVAGSTLDETRVRKDEVLAYAKACCNVERGACMVGDREYDILGAKKNQLPAIGVLYGYGSRKELEDAGADALAETPQTLLTLLLSGTVAS